MTSSADSILPADQALDKPQLSMLTTYPQWAKNVQKSSLQKYFRDLEISKKINYGF